jgi:hypothetical protein
VARTIEPLGSPGGLGEEQIWKDQAARRGAREPSTSGPCWVRDDDVCSLDDQRNLVSGGDTGVVLGLALAYGGIVQLLAGMWEFRAGNTFGAVAFSSYGAFWISFWLLVTFNAGSLANADHAISLYLWAWAIFTAYMTIASLRVSGAVLVVFVLLTATFIFLAIGQNNLPATASTRCTRSVGISASRRRSPRGTRRSVPS